MFNIIQYTKTNGEPQGRSKGMLDQKHINIIVRAIMPELYRIQGFQNKFWDFQKQRQESPSETDFRDANGVQWIRTGGQTMKKKSDQKLN